MPDPIRNAFSDPGPHTAETLAERLPGFPLPAVREALDALAAQGVLERTLREDGEPLYRYVAPERYTQIDQDVIKDPGTGIKRRPR